MYKLILPSFLISYMNSQCKPNQHTGLQMSFRLGLVVSYLWYSWLSTSLLEGNHYFKSQNDITQEDLRNHLVKPPHSSWSVSITTAPPASSRIPGTYYVTLLVGWISLPEIPLFKILPFFCHIRSRLLYLPIKSLHALSPPCLYLHFPLLFITPTEKAGGPFLPTYPYARTTLQAQNAPSLHPSKSYTSFELHSFHEPLL